MSSSGASGGLPTAGEAEACVMGKEHFLADPSPTPDESGTTQQPEKARLIIGNLDPQASSVANAQCFIQRLPGP